MKRVRPFVERGLDFGRKRGFTVMLNSAVVVNSLKVGHERISRK